MTKGKQVQFRLPPFSRSRTYSSKNVRCQGAPVGENALSWAMLPGTLAGTTYNSLGIKNTCHKIRQALWNWSKSLPSIASFCVVLNHRLSAFPSFFRSFFSRARVIMWNTENLLRTFQWRLCRQKKAARGDLPPSKVELMSSTKETKVSAGVLGHST